MNPYLDEDLLARWLKASPTAEDLLAEFRRAGVDYALINMAWLWRGDPDPDIGPAQRRVLRDFFDKYARLRFQDTEKNAEDMRWVLVYEIGPAMEKAPPSVGPLLEWYRTGGVTGLGRHGIVSTD